MLAGEWLVHDKLDLQPEQHRPLQPLLQPEPVKFGEKYNTIDASGTSLRGSMLGWSPVDLIAALGPADNHDMVGVALDWHFKDSSGWVWTLYDHKAMDFYSKEQLLTMEDGGISFSIGGEKGAATDEIEAFLLEMMAAAGRAGVGTIEWVNF